MSEYLIQDTTLDAIADAINAKTGGSSAMTPAQMVTAIGSISGGGMTLAQRIATTVPQFGDFSLVDEDPFVLDFPNATKADTLFNASTSNKVETLELHLKNATLTINTLAGGGGAQPRGLKTVRIRAGESEEIKLANSTSYYIANTPTIETLDFIFDLSLWTRDRFFAGFGVGLKNVRFKPNTIGNFNFNAMSAPSALSNDSLVSLANALKSGSATLSLSTGSKDALPTIYGTITQETDANSNTYDFFTIDAQGSTTLLDFITNTKGWTVA